MSILDQSNSIFKAFVEGMLFAFFLHMELVIMYIVVSNAIKYYKAHHMNTKKQ